ncbi:MULTISPECIES: HAD hydrolase-like protein [Staphylococcus]|uniref:HAD hydrolase-like protein n=1 Tax=Staphylococcus TaxID=1279 RepID=UPI00026C13BF|nr:MULTISPECIES: HAD hydrolase-like protein [Staphylococcus]SLD38676.1 HAD phosphatase, family IIIA [Mycobacteroides abscessus subsp. massiliense]EJE07118.1 hypothetical protein HMPREF9984_01235 [Staphylococcus epidermidis NIHLM037]MCG7819336.1 HAD hydrolase-like protein [Staphylococcus epidermidis]MCT2096615.1 HAD hydrolase-like protein [Staphylococcus epidermidis]MCT2126180.1 HAD hydrolase-like protein [Staphylococcus epidermidis]
MLDVNSSEVILIGDQLFTDIMGANLCNIKSVLVKFLTHPEEVKIGKKRKLEKVILKIYSIKRKIYHNFPNIEKENDNNVYKKIEKHSVNFILFFIVWQ